MPSAGQVGAAAAALVMSACLLALQLGRVVCIVVGRAQNRHCCLGFVLSFDMSVAPSDRPSNSSM